MSESGAQRLLESAIHRTLHAHSFSRSSSQASLLLTDFLSRYLTLLTSTCGKYAQHAGRTRLNVRDAISALEELGVTLDELHEYGSTEGIEFRRYAYHTQRRADDLREFKAQLLDGTRADHDDAIPLTYAPIPDVLEEEEEEEEEEEGYEEEEEEEKSFLEKDFDPEAMDVDVVDSILQVLTSHKRDPPRPNTPPLPLSPVSIPPSPSRKRPRTLDWEPPAHIPDFLPPFPAILEPSSSTSHSPRIPPTEPPPIPVEAARVDKPPTQPSNDSQMQTQTQTLASTSASASDYFAQVPYSQSSLSTVAEWHLPSLPPNSSSSSRTPRWATPPTEQSLITAYHHILTRSPPSSANVGNPLRHKVAMALLGLTQNTSRWDVPDTLYSNVSPNQPRVAPIGPTYPVQLGENPALDAKKDKSKDSKYPAPQPRSVATTERLSQVVNSQGSRIPDLARHVLHPATLSRTSRLSHPGVLTRDGKPLTYGNGVPAPWNANAAPSADVPNNAASKKDGQVNGVAPKESATPVILPDARLYATWDYESKDFRVPLANTVRGRAARIGATGVGGVGKVASGSGSGTGSAGTISLSMRSRSASKAT